jgi:hypothetical protein
MLVDRGRWTEVEIVEVSDRETEVFQLVVAIVETRENIIMIVYPTLLIIIYIEVHHARATNGDIIGVCQ